MISTLCIIPEPKRISYREGSFILSPKTVIRIDSSSASVKQTLKENLNQGQIKTMPATLVQRFRPFKAIRFEQPNRPGGFDPPIPTTIAPEGYILDVTPDHILLFAGDDAGLFYACQTLFQIIQAKGVIPAVRIEDAPDLKIRGAQIEPSFLAPTIESIESQLKCFARYKINTVLLGYTDKFKFDKHPRVSHPDAYTKNQLKKLDNLAQSLHINLVPILQCFGHSENVLKNPEYAHLREGPDIHTQFCPENPGSFLLFKEMAEEMMAVHASPYFHIGADDT